MKKDKRSLGRDGAPKRLTQVKVHDHMRNGQRTRDIEAGGAPLDDAPLQRKNWDGKGNVPTHPGMLSMTRPDTHDPKSGNNVLQVAGLVAYGPPSKKFARVAVKPGMRSR